MTTVPLIVGIITLRRVAPVVPGMPPLPARARHPRPRPEGTELVTTATLDAHVPRHRACPLHPRAHEPGVWNPLPGVQAVCPDDCWTRHTYRGRCESAESHRPGYEVDQGEGRFCPSCEDIVPTCGEDHCLDCGAVT